MLGQGEQDEPKTWHLRQYIKLFQTVATAKMETKQYYPKIPLLPGWSWKASVEKVSLSRNLFGDKNPVARREKGEKWGGRTFHQVQRHEVARTWGAGELKGMIVLLFTVLCSQSLALNPALLLIELHALGQLRISCLICQMWIMVPPQRVIVWIK